jgi:hypothetical protein
VKVQEEVIVSERNEKGQFAQGHKGIGGRPPKAREAARLAIISTVIDEEAFRQVVQKNLEDATTHYDGQVRARARQQIYEYLIGKPKQTIGIERTDDDAWSELADYSDEALRAIVAQGFAGGSEGGAGEEGAAEG